MRKTIVVAVREYQAAVQTKTFLITLVAMPILMGASVAAQRLLKDMGDTTDRKVAIVDESDVLYEAIAKAAREHNETQIFTTNGTVRKQHQPRFIVEEIERNSRDSDQVLFDLSERVRDGELLAFTIIPRNVIETDTIKDGDTIEYHSNNSTYRELRTWLKGIVNSEIQQLRFEKAGLDPIVVEKATHPIPIEDLGLVSMDESGRITKAEKTNEAVNFGVPAGLMMLMLMVVMVGASPLVHSVVEEKMHRIAETLLGSIPPFQLMMGKLLGTVGVSLTISTIYLVGAYGVLAYLGFAAFFPTHLLLWFFLYQALAVLMYGSLFIAVGAAVSDIKESQSMLMPVTLLIMVPLFFWTSVLQNPTSTFSVGVSLFPPATPLLMLLRQAIPPDVPIWQPLVGIVGVALTTSLFIFAAARVFRVGILMQGKGATFREVSRWAFRG